MICSKCHFPFDHELADGPDGLPTCELCVAVSYAKDEYKNAALMNAVMKSVVEMFKLDDAILGKLTEVSVVKQENDFLLKRGRGRPRKA